MSAAEPPAGYLAVRRSPGPIPLDDRPARQRIGLVVLSTDHTTERDFARMCHDTGVGVYVTRVPFANPVTVESLRALRHAGRRPRPPAAARGRAGRRGCGMTRTGSRPPEGSPARGTPVGLDDVYRARRNIGARVRRTPLVRSESLSAAVSAPVYLKLEHHQITGSFKLRGASSALANLTPRQREAGVVGVSTGNHGRGLAYAAAGAGVRCVVCMSRLVPRNKVDAIRSLGADVRIVGDSQDAAQVEVERLVAEEGMTTIPPFDHCDVIAGQGTPGLEIVEELPEVETVLIPLSGGGLVAGVALAIRPDAGFPELGEIVTGARPGRTSPEQATVADLTGTGVQDTAIATFARERCAAAGAGADFST